MPSTAPTNRRQARAMRAEPTDAEAKLWSFLRGRRLDGWKFRRQHPAPPYVLDFACVEAKLVVEADGGQHAESRSDEARAEFLTAAGWRVLRFWNSDILTNPEGVVETIRLALRPSPHPPITGRWAPPSPAGGGRGVSDRGDPS